MRRPSSTPGSRGWLAIGVMALGSILVAADPASALPAGRLVGTFAGIECEYSPGQEETVRLLAERFAKRNDQTRAELAALEAGRPESPPLSPAEMRANRVVYLQRIAEQLALAKPLPLQEECYDVFLHSYESTKSLTRELKQRFAVVQRLALWDRDELVRRLQGGEKLAGFTYDPATNAGATTYGIDLTRKDESPEAAAWRAKLRLKYNFSYSTTPGGETSYRGSFSDKEIPDAKAATAAAAGPDRTDWFPVIVPGGLRDLPVSEQVEELVARAEGNLRKLVETAKSDPPVDFGAAYLVLHETTEVGIVDRYYRGPDRRWFCDGVANYVAWRVVRDRSGPAMARRVYDLPVQLAQYADLREAADLRKWPAVENQTDTDKNSRLNSARYAYATQTVMLMAEKAGPDTLPRLFTEIGKTKPTKVTFKTVEKAWQKISGTKLEALLKEATKPLPAVAASAQKAD